MRLGIFFSINPIDFNMVLFYRIKMSIQTTTKHVISHCIQYILVSYRLKRRLFLVCLPLVCPSVTLQFYGVFSIFICLCSNCWFRTFRVFLDFSLWIPSVLSRFCLIYWIDIWYMYMDLPWRKIEQVWLWSGLIYFYMSYCLLVKSFFRSFLSFEY